MKTNPLTLIRENAGLSRRQFGLALGIGYAKVAALETGYVRTLGRAGEGLARLGHNPARVQDDLAKWLAAQATTITGANNGERP